MCSWVRSGVFPIRWQDISPLLFPRPSVSGLSDWGRHANHQDLRGFGVVKSSPICVTLARMVSTLRQRKSVHLANHERRPRGSEWSVSDSMTTSTSLRQLLLFWFFDSREDVTVITGASPENKYISLYQYQYIYFKNMNRLQLNNALRIQSLPS